MHRARGSPAAPLSRPDVQTGRKWNSLPLHSAPLSRPACLPTQQTHVFLLGAVKVLCGFRERSRHCPLSQMPLFPLAEHGTQSENCHHELQGGHGRLLYGVRANTLFRTTMGQMPALNAFSTTNFVCCRGPSFASTSSTAPSTMPSILQRIHGSLKHPQPMIPEDTAPSYPNASRTSEASTAGWQLSCSLCCS